MNLFSKFWLVANRPLVSLGTICSIVSVVALCVREPLAIWIALGALIIGLVLILWAIIRVLNSYLEKDINGNHRCISTYVTYRTEDKDHIFISVNRLIQVKCAIMQIFDTGIKWTGDHDPVWDSDLQDVIGFKRQDDQGEYDTLKLAFKNPPLYNQTAVVQYKAEINDVNHVSSTYLELRVEYPIDCIQMNVELGYKDQAANAIVERKLIHSATGSGYTPIDTVPFDPIHKRYMYQVFRPEPGYFYKISWER